MKKSKPSKKTSRYDELPMDLQEEILTHVKTSSDPITLAMCMCVNKQFKDAVENTLYSTSGLEVYDSITDDTPCNSYNYAMGIVNFMVDRLDNQEFDEDDMIFSFLSKIQLKHKDYPAMLTIFKWLDIHENINHSITISCENHPIGDAKIDVDYGVFSGDYTTNIRKTPREGSNLQHVHDDTPMFVTLLSLFFAFRTIEKLNHVRVTVDEFINLDLPQWFQKFTEFRKDDHRQRIPNELIHGILLV